MRELFSRRRGGPAGGRYGRQGSACWLPFPRSSHFLPHLGHAVTRHAHTLGSGHHLRDLDTSGSAPLTGSVPGLNGHGVN